MSYLSQKARPQIFSVPILVGQRYMYIVHVLVLVAHTVDTTPIDVYMYTDTLYVMTIHCAL